MSVTVRGIDGHPMTSYGTYQQQITVVDSIDVTRT